MPSLHRAASSKGRLPLVLALVCSALAIAGCLPNRVVLDLAPSDGELQERQVLADLGVGISTPKVALIDIEGLISFTSPGSIITSRGNIVDDVVARLDKARRDPSVRAVILRINSPGGTVGATESLYSEIARFRRESEKPIVVSMAEVAASGGYYAALAADYILAQESTITGSIGVIIQTVNLSRGLSMIGVEARALTSGPNKDLANPLEPPQEEHFRILQGIVNDFYEGFRERVRQRRPNLPGGWEATIADGRVFTGRQALAAGLVDATGDLHDAFEAAKKQADISKARLVKYHVDGRVPASAYANAQSPETASSGLQVGIHLPESMFPRAGFYYLWAPGVGGLRSNP